jgi:hypothetical protein
VAPSGVPSPFARERGRVRDHFNPVEAYYIEPLTFMLSLEQGER